MKDKTVRIELRKAMKTMPVPREELLTRKWIRKMKKKGEGGCNCCSKTRAYLELEETIIELQESMTLAQMAEGKRLKEKWSKVLNRARLPLIKNASTQKWIGAHVWERWPKREED